MVEPEWAVKEGGVVETTIPIANITDDNGDGMVDELDVPDLIVIQREEIPIPRPPGVTVWMGARLHVYSGDGAGVHWSWPGAGVPYPEHPSRATTPAVGDIDADGLPEIALVTGFAPHYLVVLGHDGAVQWKRTITGSESHGTYPLAPSISDLDHDGCAELIARTCIFDCHGTLQAVLHDQLAVPDWFPEDWGQFYFDSPPVIADLDLDGIEEVVAAYGVFDPSGKPEWDVTEYFGTVTVANLDADPEGEVLVGAEQVDGLGEWLPSPCLLLDTDGSVLLTVPAPCAERPVVVEDVDSDGWPELLIMTANPSLLWAHNHDGSLLWSADNDDQSGSATPAVFDLEGDGRVEIIIAGETMIRILDGPTGEVRWKTFNHSSITLAESPSVADVDGDGRAEFVITRGALAPGGPRQGFTVFGSGDAIEGAWAPARPVWNQFHYVQTNVGDDSSIPAQAVPHFTANNSVRSAVGAPLDPEGAYRPVIEKDVSLELVAACASDCEYGLLQLVVQVVNTGYGPVPAGIPVTARRADGELIQTLVTDSWIQEGAASDLLVMGFKRPDAGAGGITLTADDDIVGELVDECDEENNTVVVAAPTCDP